MSAPGTLDLRRFSAAENAASALRSLMAMGTKPLVVPVRPMLPSELFEGSFLTPAE
eukprot:CAMPEP_0205909120 /NCGR_PEP_ID=MMETSP1325-20131115/3663_1 /ASSEMBLY_ACC=CAM_ASM_000708 /TAXON_ID=236786 /ORGANISM="Florenciella sp., Strain RCC1007" /LENGTH=55 /DNA_ID=CAMNT_0053275391 /DNA_START=78 /DNA_END=242 /DNA_ORIENTATION=+